MSDERIAGSLCWQQSRRGGCAKWLVVCWLAASWFGVSSAAVADDLVGDAADDLVGDAADAPLAWLPEFQASRYRLAAEVAETRPTAAATEEAARLLWNLHRFSRGLPGAEGYAAGDANWLTTRAACWGRFGAADAVLATPPVVGMRGEAVRVDAVRVPETLAEVLDLTRVYRVRLQLDDGECSVVVPSVPEAWLRKGALREPVEVVGLLVSPGGAAEATGGELVVFARRLRWYPGDGWPRGWQLLASAGVDAGQWSTLGERMRKPLLAEDHDAFYGMLGAAARLGRRPEVLREARAVATIDLLQQPRELMGEWIEVPLEVARVSRVAVADRREAERLGSEAYWQLDCFGQLAGVRVELAASGGGDGTAEGNESLVFENQFPVSLAMVDLPEWLRSRMREGVEGATRVDTRMVREAVVVRGFFYRLWAYRSDYTESRGGRQVAPLVLAGDVRRVAASEPEGLGAEWFGVGMAVAVIGAVILTSVLMWRSGRRDREIRRRRRGLST